MKVFIGKSRSVWTVSSQTGSVRKLPVSLFGLLFWLMVFVGGGSVAVSFLLLNVGSERFAEMISALRNQVSNSPERQEAVGLEAMITKLQRERDGARRMSARVEDRLDSLEVILGKLTGSSDESSKGDAAKLLKPASATTQQRTTLKKIDQIVAELRHIPILSPVQNGIVTSPYGYRRGHFHHGIDISFRGTTRAVSAGGGGVVTAIGYMRGYGVYMDIEHARSITTRYAHLDRVLVKKGQAVRAGEQVAIGGATGRATGAHLHYEIRVAGRSKDPQLFLKLPEQLELVLRSDDTIDQILRG